jgi:Tol biopolymer transport system component
MWIMNADGSNPTQVTQRRPGSGSQDQFAAWSPDGRRLAFYRLNDSAEPVGRAAIFITNVDGGDIHRITPWQLNALNADWSPDGRLIIFSAHYDIEPTGHEQLYVVHPDGSGLEQVNPAGLGHLGNYQGSFSPDGRKIIFLHKDPASTDGSSVVYTMDLDGRNVTRVSFVAGDYQYLAWGTHRE